MNLDETLKKAVGMAMKVMAGEELSKDEKKYIDEETRKMRPIIAKQIAKDFLEALEPKISEVVSGKEKVWLFLEVSKQFREGLIFSLDKTIKKGIISREEAEKETGIKFG